MVHGRKFALRYRTPRTERIAAASIARLVKARNKRGRPFGTPRPRIGKRKGRRIRKRTDKNSITRQGVKVSRDSIQVRPFPKSVRGKLSSKYTYQETLTGISASAAGVQGVVTFSYAANSSQMVTDTGSGYTYYQGFKSLVGMNPNLMATPAAGVAKPDDFKFLLKSVNYQFELTNLSDIPTEITLYALLCKKDSSVNPETTWLSGLEQQDLLSTYYENTMTFPAAGLETGEAGGTPSNLQVGNYPQSSNYFKKNWRVLDVRTFQLLAAGNVKHTFTINLNKVINSMDYQNATDDSSSYIGGITIAIMAIQHGRPVIDDTNSAIMTYGPTKVGILGLKKYTMHNIMGGPGANSTVSYAVSNIPYNAANSALKEPLPEEGTNTGSGGTTLVGEGEAIVSDMLDA